jgi:quercetin dioxygenase-like cupin family protein
MSDKLVIEAAEVVLPCSELDETLTFFTGLGFRVDTIWPADDPATAIVSGHGLRLRLERGSTGDPGVLRLRCQDLDRPRQLIAPNGTRVELVEADTPLVLPPVSQSFVISRMRDDDPWGLGRAGMRYRDLIPDRQGGRFIASHIHIPDGGPVPDYVHFHKIRFQMIYCHKGWARLVYEDQGEPFILNAGDCVLQPPQIRHRVLESSPGLEVIEIGCPAEHETFADHVLTLPTADTSPTRQWAGQRFVRHVAAGARWQPWRADGFEFRDIGIATATDGLAGVRVVRPIPSSAPPSTAPSSHGAEFLFFFVLSGTTTLIADDHEDMDLAEGDSFVIPEELRHGLERCSPDLELLEVSLPAVFDVVVQPVAVQA